MGRPERPEAVKPVVDLAQRLRRDGVEPARPLGAHGGKAGFTQDSQLGGDRRLRDPELVADHLADGSGRELAAGKQLEDSPADRVAEDVEGRNHNGKEDISHHLYKQ